MMLSDFGPVSHGNIVEAQGRARGLRLGNESFRPLPLGGLYFFGFAPVRDLGRAEKPTTSPLEVELEER
jgi:hypothetical protein